MSEFYGAMFYIGRMFWKKHPALALGIATLLGCFVALQPSWCLFIPAVFVVFLPRVLTLQSLLMGLLTYFFASYSVVMPQGQAERSWRGSALCEVIDLKQEIKYGEPLWKMKLHIHSFHGDCDAKNFPATTICKTIAKRPQGGCTYKVQGTLKKVSDSGVSFSFREQSKEGWRKKEEKFSLVEWRNLAKMRLKCFFRGHLPPGEARIFLEGLAFGEFHDPVLQENIRRLGLSHIMVVSGFHFSLIALFMAFVFSFFFSWKRSILALLIGATLYLLLIGPTPSVARAWVSIALCFAGKFFEKKTNGLNTLGVGLIALLLYEPLWCLHIGFQLSFLATSAILLFYPFVDRMMSQILMTRKITTVLKMPWWDQLLYMAMVFFRKSWALGLSVNIFMLPMSFFVFQQFPILGLFYNAFFPFLASIALFLLCTSCLLSAVPFVSTLLFAMTYHYTDMILRLVSDLPHSLDVTLYVNDFPGWLVIALITGASGIGIWLHETQEAESEQLLNYM